MRGARLRGARCAAMRVLVDEASWRSMRVVGHRSESACSVLVSTAGVARTKTWRGGCVRTDFPAGAITCRPAGEIFFFRLFAVAEPPRPAWRCAARRLRLRDPARSRSRKRRCRFAKRIEKIAPEPGFSGVSPAPAEKMARTSIRLNVPGDGFRGGGCEGSRKGLFGPLAVT